MQFTPIWISSIAHLTEFDRIYRETHWLPRALGYFPLPANFPRMEVVRFCGYQLAFPILMLSEGQLEIRADLLHYQAHNAATLAATQAGKAMFHLRTDWKFSVSHSEITSIEPMPWRSPVFRYYDMPFVRVRTTHPDVLASDFLVCAGGRGALMGKIRQRSEQIATELQKLSSG